MISSRKDDHINICLEEDVETGSTGFEDVVLLHRIPQIDKRSISLRTKFLAESLNIPFMISAMTGGCSKGEKINSNLAEAAEKLGIAIMVGSQRAAVEDSSLEKTYSVVRKKAPSAFVIANIGAVQLKHYSLPEIKQIIRMVGADALAVHFNPLQEAVQPEGDTDFSNVLKNLKRICSKIPVPVIAKEIGCGFCREDAIRLKKAGIKAIDVAGSGGTSFSLVESYRGRSVGKTFKNWGIPTAASLIECRGLRMPVIASGGMRNGLDAAKALALGADLVGYALPLLKPATRSAKAVIRKIKTLEEELRTSMFLTNCENLRQLRKSNLYVKGDTAGWM